MAEEALSYSRRDVHHRRHEQPGRDFTVYRSGAGRVPRVHA